MWRRPLEWNLNGTTDPRDGSVDHLSLNSLKDRHGPIRAPKSQEDMERPERAALRQSGDNPINDPQREVEELRAGVNCATVLEKATPPWLLDRKESSQRCLKYRRAAGEIVIVTHGGAGWWDRT